ncbi:hypothetical protein V1478_003800 [Vespula squamosa]|uniref:Uncharacterized protein n=1 Tax=Vespula squamosa TaxID=30214 RepID=A0ABD2BMV0_VESSQ
MFKHVTDAQKLCAKAINDHACAICLNMLSVILNRQLFKVIRADKSIWIRSSSTYITNISRQNILMRESRFINVGSNPVSIVGIRNT